MRKSVMRRRLVEAEVLVGEVRAYIREHDHPIRDGHKLDQDYKAMQGAVRRWLMREGEPGE